MRGVLTTRLMGHPFGVLLLDELEKAHPTVHDRLLQLVDEGGFINGQGEMVQCRSLILIATTNAGAELYRSQRFGFSEGRRAWDITKAIQSELERLFRFEFLNRFDRIVHFHPLRRKHIRVIAQRELGLLRERSGIKQRKLSLDVDESVLDWLSVRGYDPDYGARFLKRLIERDVTSTLAEAILRESAEPGSRIELRIRGNQVTARVHARKPASGSVEPLRAEARTKPAPQPQEPEVIAAQILKVLDAAKPLLSSLAAKREERSSLIERMNEQEFWDNRKDNKDVLERFRELDVDVRTESRLARPIERMKDLFERVGNVPRPPPPPPRKEEMKRLARELVSAESALADWELRRVEEGPRSVWLLLESVELFEPVDKWLGDLVELERRWCRKLHLQSEIVAYSIAADKLARVAMQAEGVGAYAILTMEQGIHRLSVSKGADPKVRMRVLAKDQASPGPPVPVTPIKPRTGLMGLALSCRGRVEVEERGFVSDWVADDEDTLSELLTLLRQTWQNSGEISELARVYGRDGAGARDPRIAAQHPRAQRRPHPISRRVAPTAVSQGTTATIRTGPPEPLPIFTGRAMTQNPFSGSSSTRATFSRFGTPPPAAIWCAMKSFD